MDLFVVLSRVPVGFPARSDDIACVVAGERMANSIGVTRATATETSTAAVAPGDRAELDDKADAFVRGVDVTDRPAVASEVNFACFAGSVRGGGRRQCRCWWEGGGGCQPETGVMKLGPSRRRPWSGATAAAPKHTGSYVVPYVEAL